MQNTRERGSPSKQPVPQQSSKKVYKPGHTSKAINSTIRGVNTKSFGLGYSSTNSQEDKQKDQDAFVPRPLILTEEDKKKPDDSESRSKPSQSNASERKDEGGSSEVKADSLSFSMKSIDRVDTLSEISDDASKESKEPVNVKKEVADETISTRELEDSVVIELSETKTITLFSLPARAVRDDATARASVVQRNESYGQLIKEKYASDSYQGRAAQTFATFVKNKEASSESLRVEDATIGNTEWEIFDAFREEAPDAKAIILREFNEEVSRAFKSNLKIQGLLLDADSAISATAMSNSMTQSMKNSEKLSSSKGVKSSQRVDQSSRSVLSSSHSINASKNSALSGSAQQAEETTPFKPPEDVKLPETLVEKFNIVERILTQNTYLEEQILYRNYPKIDFPKRELDDSPVKMKTKQGAFPFFPTKKVDEKQEEEVKESTEPELADLFQFYCPRTKNKKVCCADWNTRNPDLLAVSYGEYNHVDSNQEGLLLFWTLKSPRFPERTISADTGLVSCEFSRESPNLIATGSYDGIVALYDLRVAGNKPIADSSELPGKHIDTVWEVRWLDTGTEEELISIAADGKVYKWSIKKGLEFKCLSTLKKPSNPNMKDGRDGPVFREAVGFSLDAAENPIYYVSTEECTIHKCSFSYTEELETYWGHTGPVYKIRCSPFYKDVFLTCSADWTCQLWHSRREDSLLTIHSMDLTDAVNDIEWAPGLSTMFAGVADDGRVEVWDIAQSTLKPIIVKTREDRVPRTVVKFCKQFPVLISGDAGGVIDVFRIKNITTEQLTPSEQRKRLEAALFTNNPEEETKAEDEEEKA